jgi:hypothetical protein
MANKFFSKVPRVRGMLQFEYGPIKVKINRDGDGVRMDFPDGQVIHVDDGQEFTIRFPVDIRAADGD